jgi:Fic family protein
MIKEINTFHSGKYTFDSTLKGAAASINTILEFLENTPVFPHTVNHLKKISAGEFVYFNGKIEKSSITLELVENIIQHNRDNFSQDMSALATANFYTALKYVNNNIDKELTPELIHNVHNELIEGIQGIKDKPGQYRNGGAKADEKWLEKPFTPVASTLDINFIVKNITETLNSEMGDVNPLIKGIMLHLHLKKVQPYNNANGDTARLLEFWYLKKNGLETIAGILSRIYAEKVEEYYKVMSEFYETSDISPFLSFIAGELDNIFDDVRRENNRIMMQISIDYYLNKLLTEKSLIKRQYEFLKLIKDKNITFTHEDLQLKKEFTKLYGKVSRTTVSRDITKFLEMNLIVESGERYSFNTNIMKF